MYRVQRFPATCTVQIETFNFHPLASSLKCWLSINECRPVCLCYSLSSQASVDVFSFVSNYLLFCLCNIYMHCCYYMIYYVYMYVFYGQFYVKCCL